MVNWASTCANHSSGSEGQNGGILIVTEFVVMVTFEVVFEVEGGELSAVEGVSSIVKEFLVEVTNVVLVLYLFIRNTKSLSKTISKTMCSDCSAYMQAF